MTQIKEGLSRANPKPMLTMSTDVGTPSTDKKPSPELFEMIQAAASSMTGFMQLWDSIKKKGNSEGFTDTELEDFIKPLLKQQLNMSKDQIWYMFNKEKKAIANKEAYEKTRINPPIDKKKDPPPEENALETENEYLKESIKEKDEQIQAEKIRGDHLEEALQKTEQFKPATQLQEPKPDEFIEEEEKFEKSLKRRADGSHSFYYDAYGIDLFKNRELSQLKNSGVKVFRRLYFEV